MSKLATDARQWHYKHSLPWTDEGLRILPAVGYTKYTSEMRNFRLQFEGLAESHFIARLPEWEEWARKTHNGTFNPSDYLTADQLREKFGFAAEMQPVPCGEDFRVSFAEEEMEAMRSSVDNRVAAAVEAARKDLWHRLVGPVSAMVERLSQPDAKFRDSLVGNLRDIIQIIPALNLTSDPQLESFRVEIAKELAIWNPDDLRDSKLTRKQVADKAAEILAKMQGYTRQTK